MRKERKRRPRLSEAAKALNGCRSLRAKKGGKMIRVWRAYFRGGGGALSHIFDEKLTVCYIRSIDKIE